MTYGTNGRERSRAGGVTRRFWAWAALLILVLVAAPAAAVHPVQIYYFPLPEEEILTAFQTLDTGGTLLSGDTSIRTVVSITVTQTGTIIYYDQWENDFEVEIDNPDDLYNAGNPGGTQIWGDGDTSNGFPPGVPGDVITGGAVITLDNVVPAAPRNPANLFFDGGDKIATTWPIAVTRAAWPVPTTGTVVAGAVEVFPTRDWDTTYQAPGGENLAVSCTTTSGTDDLADFCMFQDSRLLIMARQDQTQVSVDVDGDGNDDISQTLDEGESLTVDGAQAGSVITSTAPVQVNELTGDVGARFEARWFGLVPLDEWSDSYLAPVGTVTGTAAGRTANASVVLFNPDSTDLTINVATPSGTSPLTVPAGGVTKFIMPGPAGSSGAGFTSSDGRTFFALAAADDERVTHDWGHTVLPESSLSIDLKVGWAVGSNGAENSSPVWITARTATTVCADFDDNGVPDQTFALSAYESLKIYDSDGDQTGLRVFSTTDATCSPTSPKNGALLAGAWGQDPFTASTGNPALDLGTTVLQVPPIILAKEGSLAVDVNGNGLVDPGDALRYNIGVLNSGTATATGVTLSDTLDPNTSYIVNSTTRDALPVPDDTAPATPFPLDEGGLSLGNLGPGVRTEIEFLVEINPALPPGVDSIVNQAIVTTGTGESSDDSASAPVFDGNPRVSKISNVGGSVLPGDVITYSIAPRNDTLELQTNIEVADTIPTSTTFVGGSASPPQDSGPDPLVWNLGSNVPGTPGSNVGGYVCGEAIDLPASQDTYVNEDRPTEDRSGVNELLTNPDSAGNKIKRPLYQFDLAGIPSGATITGAELTITSRDSRSNHLANVKQVTTAWTEAATWNTTNGTTAWGTAGGDFSSTVLGTLTPVGGDSQQTADITSLVQGWVAGTFDNYGVILDPSGTDTGDAKWSSKEDGTETRRPFIRAYYTFTSPGGCPSTVQVTARQDTYIEEDDVTADNSTANTLLTRPQPAGQINRALYQFSVGSIPAGAIVDSAVLNITSRNSRSNHLVDVKRVTTFWTAGSANWNAPWTTPGGDFSSVVLGTLTPLGGDAQQTVDVTALVQDWVDGTLTNFGVILDPRGTDAGDAQWSSMEDGTESRRPFITITYRSLTVRRTLPVTQDTFINQDQPDEAKGTDDPVLTNPDSGASNVKRALFQFESDGIPANATINSAALVISSANTRSNHLANVKHLTNSWTESATWNTRDGSTSWTSAGGDFFGTVYGTFRPVGGNNFGKVDVTALVQDWVDGTLSNYGVILDPSGTDTGDAQWNSREDGEASLHPFIDVTYLAASLGSSTTTAMTAEGSLVTDGDTITVTMELTSNTADTNVTPGSLNVAGTNGASAVCGSPSPTDQSIGAGTPISFVWTCTANAGATPGSVIFTAAATGDSSTFAAATSNSVLVSPLLTFQVVVDDPLDRNVTSIFNTAEMTSDQQPEPNKDTVVDPVDVGAAIGNSVWLDVDGDGIQDVGEDGLANVVVELRDGVCTPAVDCPTTTTDANGNYLFAFLAPGTYTVAVLSGVPTGLVDSPGNSGGVSNPIVISGSQEFLNADFGYTAQGGAGGTGVIGNYVWSDADGDGLQDPGEPGIGGVTVDLLGPGPDGILGTADDVAVASTTTGADGSYLFTGVAPGQYQVAITDTATVLGGYTATSGPQSEGSYVSVPVTVASGSVSSEVDFGFANGSLFSISDSIWVDSDGDGVRDAGEAGIAGVTVNLRDAFGNIIATTISDASGNFSFDGLVDNSKYLVDIADVTGLLAGLGGTTPPARIRQLGVSMSGADVIATNFGYNAPASVRGVIWNDADGDGVQDPEEIGLAGVTVELQDGCTAGVDCPIIVTAADGSYSFVGLRPDLYTVEVTDTAGALTGYTQTGDPDEAGSCSICDSLSTTIISLTRGDQTLDFGYRNSTLDDISGKIFDDEDADGVEDPGEGGLAGATVELLDDAGNVLAMTTTDANGDYAFPDLPSGSYSVRVTDEAGFLDGYSLTSGLDELSAQPGDSDVDFGYTRRPGTAAIGDRLWLDADGDGQAGPSEAGLSGVVVVLWEDTDADGVRDTLIASTVTDANGDYVFDGLSAGSYFVDVDETTLPVTASGDLVETAYPAGTDPSAVIALSATERFGGADFGYLPVSGTAVLGDRVWYDADGDGLQDPGELGIGGVDVSIVGPGCSPCTVTTNADGSWLATGLAPGEFFVSFDSATLPAGYNTIPTNLGGDDTYSITVAANDLMTQLDFGFDGGTTGTIGDGVWLDENGDGARDVGEPGLSGVTVNLLDSSGNIIATTTTVADGSYLFSGVPDGNYTISISDIGGILVGLPQSYDPDESGVCTTCDMQGSVSVTGGVSAPADVDFGFAPSGGTGTIGDFVWHDATGDGVQDPGESGIQGVTLELWLDVNGDGVITPGLDNLVRNAVTDQNGEYQFSSLPDEDYVVRVTDTAGVVSSFVQTGDPDEAGSCTMCDGQGVLTLTGGSGDFGQDFGYAAPVGMAYSISGTVFDDQNQDGDFDSPGESGVEGALVVLFNDLDGDGVLDPGEPYIGSTVSDANGNYSLADLPPGDYLVAVDTSGSAVDGYLQTTQTLSAGLQPVTISSADVADQDFGFWSGGFITTPVTLAYFSSEGSGSVSFQWATATETGNLGFHLYVLEEEGLRRLNETLIPSQVGDALTPQRYALEAWDVDGDVFVLEDVDLYGQTRYHGPFELGRTYGREVWDVKRTDWMGIAREHERKTLARRPRRRSGLGAGSVAGSRSGGVPAVQLRVRENGIYRVTYETLLAAGIDLGGVPAAQLALLERGTPKVVPVEGTGRSGSPVGDKPMPIWVGESDRIGPSIGGKPVPIRVGGSDHFGPGSFVEFVGRGLDTLYTDTNVYTLIAAPRRAARVDRDASRPSTWARIPGFYYETRTVETNRAYDFAAPGDDPWYDTRLLAISEPVEAIFELELEDRLPEVGEVELTVAMWGVTDFPQMPDHHVVIEVNGVELADEWFDGLEDRPVRVDIPEWVLAPQNNRLRVLLPHDTGALYDLVNYDHYRVRFPRRFAASSGRLHFTAAAAAFRVDGLPSADVVVYRVTNEGMEFIEAVEISGLPGDYSATFSGSQRPATYYVSTVESLRVPRAELAPRRKIDLEGEAEMLIIAHPDFLDGLDPLVAARRSEGLSVQVVNVEELYQRFSSGVVDPGAIRDYIRRAYRKMGTEYVLLVGGDTYDYFDYLGQGAISFVPTLYTRTDPIVHYAPVDPLYGDINQDGVPEVAVGRWPVRTTAELETILQRTLQYADIDYPRTAVFSADAYDVPAGYSFSAASEEMLSYLPGTWQAERAYLDELSLQEARQLLIDEINYGVALTSYFGHSGPAVWSFDGLFDSRDADELENFGRPTVVTQWGCWNNYHVMPSYDTLGHRLLLNDGRGAAAVLGAATLTEALSEQKLGRELFAQMGSQRRRLGKALIDAKKELAVTDPDRLDVLLGWTLLGDPTLVVEP